MATKHNAAVAPQVEVDDPAANPREIIGANNPPTGTSLALLPFLPADDLNVRLPETYSGLSADVTTLLADIRASAPEKVESEADNEVIGKLITRLRDTIKRDETHHAAEKQPYLSSGRSVDQFFFGMRDRMAKARDILQARGNDYTARKVAAERQRREAEAIAAAAAARAAAEAVAKAERERQELEAAAARARKPENIEKLEHAAEIKGTEAAVRQIDQMVAATAAQTAAHATLATSAAIARTRFDSGVLATAKQTGYVEILDDSQLDMRALWPFIKADVKLAALKTWAKSYNYEKAMPGAIIELRDIGEYR